MLIALVNNIVGQQISTKAHITVWKRFSDLVKEINPTTINNINIEHIHKCGMSMKKTSHIKDLALKVEVKELEIDKLLLMNDDEVIKELVKLKGIGRWTAEMLMIFSMNMKNIISFDDLAIKKGRQNALPIS